MIMSFLIVTYNAYKQCITIYHYVISQFFLVHEFASNVVKIGMLPKFFMKLWRIQCNVLQILKTILKITDLKQFKFATLVNNMKPSNIRRRYQHHIVRNSMIFASLSVWHSQLDHFIVDMYFLYITHCDAKSEHSMLWMSSQMSFSVIPCHARIDLIFC